VLSLIKTNCKLRFPDNSYKIKLCSLTTRYWFIQLIDSNG